MGIKMRAGALAVKGVDRWYVTDGANSVGPVNLELLTRGIEAGRVPLDSFVRHEGWKVWRPLTDFADVDEGTAFSFDRHAERGAPRVDASFATPPADAPLFGFATLSRALGTDDVPPLSGRPASEPPDLIAFASDHGVPARTSESVAPSEIESPTDQYNFVAARAALSAQALELDPAHLHDADEDEADDAPPPKPQAFVPFLRASEPPVAMVVAPTIEAPFDVVPAQPLPVAEQPLAAQPLAAAPERRVEAIRAPSFQPAFVAAQLGTEMRAPSAPPRPAIAPPPVLAPPLSPPSSAAETRPATDDIKANTGAWGAARPAESNERLPTDEFAGAKDLKDALLLLLSATLRRLRADVGLLHEMFDHGAEVVSALGPHASALTGVKTSLHDAALVAAAGGTVIVAEPMPGAAGESMLRRLHQLKGEKTLQGAVMVPIRPNGRLLGFLEVGREAPFAMREVVKVEDMVAALLAMISEKSWA